MKIAVRVDSKKRWKKMDKYLVKKGVIEKSANPYRTYISLSKKLVVCLEDGTFGYESAYKGYKILSWKEWKEHSKIKYGILALALEFATNPDKMEWVLTRDQVEDLMEECLEVHEKLRVAGLL